MAELSRCPGDDHQNGSADGPLKSCVTRRASLGRDASGGLLVMCRVTRYILETYVLYLIGRV